jgi:hypothetical protein
VSSAPARTGVRARRPALAVVGVAVLCAAGAVSATSPAGAPGSVRFAGLGSATQVERRQAVTNRVGAAPEPLSFLSLRSADAPPFPGADAVRVAPGARAQPAVVVAQPPVGSNAAKPARKRVSLATLGWAVLAVAVLAVAVATPLLLRRHRNRQDTPP